MYSGLILQERIMEIVWGCQVRVEIHGNDGYDHIIMFRDTEITLDNVVALTTGEIHQHYKHACFEKCRSTDDRLPDRVPTTMKRTLRLMHRGAWRREPLYCELNLAQRLELFDLRVIMARDVLTENRFIPVHFSPIMPDNSDDTIDIKIPNMLVRIVFAGKGHISPTDLFKPESEMITFSLRHYNPTIWDRAALHAELKLIEKVILNYEKHLRPTNTPYKGHPWKDLTPYQVRQLRAVGHKWGWTQKTKPSTSNVRKFVVKGLSALPSMRRAYGLVKIEGSKRQAACLMVQLEREFSDFNRGGQKEGAEQMLSTLRRLMFTVAVEISLVLGSPPPDNEGMGHVGGNEYPVKLRMDWDEE